AQSCVESPSAMRMQAILRTLFGLAALRLQTQWSGSMTIPRSADVTSKMLRSAAKHQAGRTRQDVHQAANKAGRTTSSSNSTLCNIHSTTRFGAPFRDRTPDSQLDLGKLCIFKGMSR